MDIIVPIVLNPDALLTADDMSGLMIRVKNKPSPDVLDGILPLATKVGPDWGRGAPRPYIAMTFELGLSEPSVSVVPQSGDCAAPEVWPRYGISFQGCSNQVFGLIGCDEDAIFSDILGSEDVFQQHPRKSSPEFLRALASLKPEWGAKEQGIFNWAVAPKLNEI